MVILLLLLLQNGTAIWQKLEREAAICAHIYGPRGANGQLLMLILLLMRVYERLGLLLMLLLQKSERISSIGDIGQRNASDSDFQLG